MVMLTVPPMVLCTRIQKMGWNQRDRAIFLQLEYRWISKITRFYWSGLLCSGMCISRKRRTAELPRMPIYMFSIHRYVFIEAHA